MSIWLGLQVGFKGEHLAWPADRVQRWLGLQIGFKGEHLAWPADRVQR